jgi:hypothetical protein
MQAMELKIQRKNPGSALLTARGQGYDFSPKTNLRQ